MESPRGPEKVKIHVLQHLFMHVISVVGSQKELKLVTCLVLKQDKLSSETRWQHVAEMEGKINFSDLRNLVPAILKHLTSLVKM